MAQDWTWDKAYADYAWTLRNGEVTEDKIRSWYEPLSKDFADRIVAIHKDITKQSNVDKWWGGDIGKEDAAWDMAFRLAETGAGSLYDIGQRQVERTVEGEGGPYSTTDFELFNKRTGEPLTRFNQVGFDNIYNLQFTPEGVPVAYTENETSDWVDFREGAKFLANTIGMFTPAAPYIAAANAANFASKGQLDKAILTGLPAAGYFAGQFGAAADTVSAINEANKYAKVLKALDDKRLLDAAFQGADLVGISKMSGYDLGDVKKAVDLGMAIKNAEQDPMALVRAGSAFAPKDVYGHDPSMLKEGSFRYNDVFDPKTAGLVDLSEQPIEGYEFTKDFTPGVGLDLFPDLQGPGIKAPPMETDVFRPDGSVNYDIFDFEGYKGEPGLEMPRAPNMPSMGGGQGFVVPVEGGVMTESGFIPTGYTPDLGDPSSFINKPAPGAEVSGSVQKALDAGAAATAKDINKAGQTKSQTQQQPGSGVDFAGLLGLLGSLGGQQAPSVLAVPENSADIKLMEEIFGTSLSAPSTGNETDKAEALARLLRS